jgi:hypothetical protein
MRLTHRSSPASLWTALICLGLVVPALSHAQSADVQGLRIKELHPAATPAPFDLHGNNFVEPELQFLAPEAMKPADRDLLAANQGEILERAARQGFNLEMSGTSTADWTYEQAVCPAFPQHLILEYSRGNAQGDITLLSVVIPRGEGHVRVIPARRRGYSLFTPVASNDITLNDFNHIVLEEGLRERVDSHRKSKTLSQEHVLGGTDWLTLGLCYSALASGHVHASLQPTQPIDETYPLAIPAQLRMTERGGADVWFADTTPDVKSMQWELRFAQDGRLLKVRHVNSTLLRKKPLPGQVIDAKGIPTSKGVVDLNKPGN